MGRKYVSEREWGEGVAIKNRMREMRVRRCGRVRAQRGGCWHVLQGDDAMSAVLRRESFLLRASQRVQTKIGTLDIFRIQLTELHA